MHFLHILGHRTLLVERKHFHFQLSSAAYRSNNNFVAVQSYGGQLLDCPHPLATPLTYMCILHQLSIKQSTFKRRKRNVTHRVILLTYLLTYSTKQY